MGKRLIPDPIEIRDQIHRLREEIANWQRLIENAERRIAQLSRRDYAEVPPPDRRPPDENSCHSPSVRRGWT